MRGRIEAGLATLGVPCDGKMLDTLVRYGAMLLEKNTVMNLTAITQPEQVADLHFLDSAALLTCVSFEGRSVIDVGTGAGFPGLVLKILQPSLSLTLLDGLQKRLDWLGEVCQTLGIQGVTILHGRAEEESLKPQFRDGFDFATARAVANMGTLCELCLPYVKVGGQFLAMKTPSCAEELIQSEKAVNRLGGKLLSGVDYAIPGTEIVHRVVPVEKIAPTPAGFPRRWAKIKADNG